MFAVTQENHNQMVTGRPPVALSVKLFKGMKLFLTRNVNKEADFINGMEVTVQDYAKASGCVHVLTKTGRHLAIYPITDWVKEAGYVTAYPLRPGYASTIHKLQGAELEHITIWLERRDARAAAYVAMSRVQRGSDYLIGGQVTRRHFTPAM